MEDTLNASNKKCDFLNPKEVASVLTNEILIPHFRSIEQTNDNKCVNSYGTVNSFEL